MDRIFWSCATISCLSLRSAADTSGSVLGSVATLITLARLRPWVPRVLAWMRCAAFSALSPAREMAWLPAAAAAAGAPPGGAPFAAAVNLFALRFCDTVSPPPRPRQCCRCHP